MNSAFTLNFILNFAEDELENINDYMRFMESHLEKKSKEINDKLVIEANISPKTFPESYLREAPTLRRIEGFHPNLLRQSMIVALYSFLEKSLNSICTELQMINDLELSFTDIQGKGLTRAKAYIKKVIKLPFPDQSEHWPVILLLNDVRNAIVHSGGDLEPKIVEKLQKRKDLENLFSAEDGLFLIEKGFAETMSDHVAKFIASLRDVLPKYSIVDGLLQKSTE